LVLNAFFSLKSDSDKLLKRYLKDYFNFTPFHLQLYKQALMHKSMTQNKNEGVRHSNERLEFLGDAIIDAIIGDYLYHTYPNENEGFLTKARSKLVSRKHLSHLALATGLDKLLVSDVKNKNAMANLAGNAFEALIGSIYLRKGYPFVEKRLIALIKKFTLIDEFLEIDDDFKSKIYQWAQKHKKSLEFKANELVSKKSFEVELLIDTKIICSATDKTIKSAEQAASKIAVKLLNIDENS
jgi:ribonuclease-3